MNKFYLNAASVLFMASLAVNVSAQQIQNAGFEGEWPVKVPYAQVRPELASGYSIEKRTEVAEKIPFYMPEFWDGSNTCGGVANSSFPNPVQTITPIEGGHNSETAVMITDKLCGSWEDFMIPGYLTLGTAFSTAEYQQKIAYGSFVVQKGKCENRDWGTFGGAEFTSRPDAVAFYYKRAGATQDATVVAYLWKGTYNQTSVHTVIGSAAGHADHFDAGQFPGQAGELPATNMENRDRAILGMETTTGLEVTKSDDAELIASVTARISETPSEWTLFECPLDYKSQATPEKINIIIAAGDYFGENTAFVDGNSISVDDVNLVYYSRIRSIKIGDFTMELEAGKYTFDVPADYPENQSDLELELWGQDAKVQMVYPTPDNKSYSIAVKNDSGNDIDGKGFHAYTLHFTGTPEPVEPEGNLTIDLWKVEAVAFPTAYTEKIGTMTGNISYDEATKHYTIKDFLGIKKANLTFYIDENGTPESPVDLGYGTTNPMKNNVKGFENEDDYMVRIVMPDASEQQGDLADWTNIIIPGVDSWGDQDHKLFSFKFSEESFNQKDIKPEFATGIFKGEENDYMLLNPSFGGHWGDASKIRQSSMKKCHAAKIDNKWTVRIYCNETTVNQKASADAEWEWNRATYRLSSPLIMFTIPADLGAGVEGIETDVIDANAPVEYYNLQGIKVENPAAGLYIKRQGNKVEKVVIR